MLVWACVCVCVELLPIPRCPPNFKFQKKKKEKGKGVKGGREGGGRELTKRPSALHHVSCWQSADTPLLPAGDQ